MLEFVDACKEGDGERVFRCWKIFLPHFRASNNSKYALECLRLQFQVKSVCSPQLAHHILWDRFVNTRGGLGNNIPCDLHNEHVNKRIKHITEKMGPNLTESALQSSARSVTILDDICRTFDEKTNVPVSTVGHSSRSDEEDIQKVSNVVLKEKLLHFIPQRSHTAFLE